MYFVCFTADSAIPLEFDISGELGFHLNPCLWASSLIIWLSNSGPPSLTISSRMPYLMKCFLISLTWWYSLESFNHCRNNPHRLGIFFHPVSWYRGQYVGMSILALVFWLVSPCYFSQNICCTLCSSYNIPGVHTSFQVRRLCQGCVSCCYQLHNGLCVPFSLSFLIEVGTKTLSW